MDEMQQGLTGEQRERLFMHDVGFTVGDALGDMQRFAQEVIFPVRRRLRAADPHAQVYQEGMVGELAQAWGRWGETRCRVLAGRNVTLGEALDSGWMLEADAPREVVRLDPAWVARRAEIERRTVERMTPRLQAQQQRAIQATETEMWRLVRLLEPRDYWLDDPWSAEVRRRLAWFAWAARAYRGTR